MSKESPFNKFIKLQQPLWGGADIESVLNSLPQAAIVIRSGNGHIQLVNTKASELTAYTHNELIGMEYNLILQASQTIEPELDVEQEDEITGETVNPLLFELVKRGGSRTLVQVSTTPLGEKNKYSLITFELDDICRQRQDYEERYQQLWSHLNHLSEAMLEPDLDASLSVALQAGSDLSGASIICIYQGSSQNPILQRIASLGSSTLFPEQITSQDFTYLQKPVLWVKGKRSIVHLHRLAQASNIPYIASAPIGELNALIGLLVISGEKTPPPENILTILTYLSSQINTIIQGHVLIKQLQKDIQGYLTKIAINTAIYNSMEDGAIILSPDLSIRSLNPSAELYLGYASVEVYGQKIENVLIGSDDLKASFQAVQNEQRSDSIGSIKLFRRNGETFLASLRIIPILNESILDSIIILFQDLSEQEEYRLRNQQLEQRALLGEVTASFAHEVRNPINNISTGLQLLAINLPQNDPNQENISRLESDCERLAYLVKSSLTFVRPMEYKLEQIDLSQLVSNLLERWRSRLVKLSIKYQVQTDKSVPTIEGDLRALEQVFTNLINNAIQAMEETGGMLSIKIRRAMKGDEPSHVEVSISDTGPGIPPELRERIFEPFFTTKQHGTGLGLAIVKRIVTAHKGSIYVNSIPGGTSFLVRIPCA